MAGYAYTAFPQLPRNLEKPIFGSFLFRIGKMPEMLFKYRETLELGLKVYKICQNLEFCMLEISYGLKFVIGILIG